MLSIDDDCGALVRVTWETNAFRNYHGTLRNFIQVKRKYRYQILCCGGHILGWMLFIKALLSWLKIVIISLRREMSQNLIKRFSYDIGLK